MARLTQQPLPLDKPPSHATRRGRLSRGERLEEENRAAAIIVLRRPELYGEGLCRWARLVLRSEGNE